MAYRVVRFRSTDGESMCLLERSDGSVHCAATEFGTSMVRSAGKSLASELQQLSAISCLLEFCDSLEIDLMDRVRCSELFTYAEITRLTDFLAKAKGGSTTHVKATQQAMRMRYVSDFLCFLFDNLNDMETRRRNLIAFTGIIKQLLNRVPKISSTGISVEKDLSDAELREVAVIVQPGSDRNPFRAGFHQIRNKLVFDVILETGMRAGELLGLRLRDLDAPQKQLAVIRRQDNAADPRSRPAHQKTRERKLFIKATLVNRIQDYIVRERSPLLARYGQEHDFLIISDCGAPLSVSSLSKLFATVEKSSSISQSFSPHTLRHTWNRLFSEVSDENTVDPEEERQLREYQQGWKPGSTTALIYNQRHIREKARHATQVVGDRIAAILSAGGAILDDAR